MLSGKRWKSSFSSLFATRTSWRLASVMTTKLGEKQCDELVPAAVIFSVAVALVLLFELFEFISRKIPEQLSQNRRNLLHGLKHLLNTAVIEMFGHFQYRRFLLGFRSSLFLPDTTGNFTKKEKKYPLPPPYCREKRISKTMAIQLRPPQPTTSFRSRHP